MRDKYVFRKELEPASRFYIELELDPEELQAIGHVAAQWAFLEYHIFLYTKLASEGRLGQPLPKEAENDSFRKRKIAWEIVTKTALADEPEQLSRVLAIIERVGSLQGERHKLIHGLIQWNESDRNSLDLYSRANPSGTPWKVDAKRIEDFARKIATLNADFLNVHNENPDFPDLVLNELSLPRRPGTPIPVDFAPEPSETLKSILEAHKHPKQSSEE